MASFRDVEWRAKYYPDDDKEKTRLIGLELEAKPLQDLGETKFSFLEEYRAIDQAREAGYEVDEYNEYDDCDETNWDEVRQFQYDKLIENEVEVGGFGHDGGGIEMALHPDSITLYKKGGSDRLKRVLDVLEAYTEADPASGTHINISKLDGDVDGTINNIYWIMMTFAPQFQKIFGRVSSWANPPRPSDAKDALGTGYIVYNGRKKRPDLNISCNDSKHSIVVDKKYYYEFRGCKASHDINEIIAWIEICHAITETAARSKDLPDMTLWNIIENAGPEAVKYVSKLKHARTLTYTEKNITLKNDGLIVVPTVNTRFGE